MISLRQHIFSLVAVFVALAIGIAAGSTVVRGPLLESTRARLESAEQLIDIERAENEILAAEVDQLEGFAEEGPEQLLAGRLTGSSVLLIVAGDVESTAVRGVIRSVRAAASEYLGQIRLDPSLFDPEDTAAVAEAIGLDPATPTEQVLEVFGERAAQQIAEVGALLEGEIPEQGAVRAVFGDLEDAGLVDLLDVPGTATGSSEFDVVVLTDRNVPHDPAPLLEALVTRPIGDAAVLADTVMLVAEVGRLDSGNDEPVPSFVGRIRDDGRLRDEVSTVDNAETILGWVAVVLGLEASQRGLVGHYGFRSGADQAIPARGS